MGSANEQSTPMAPRITPVHESPVTFTMLNAQGLITNKRNKCGILFNEISKPTIQPILAVTESWLTPGVYDAEILHHFPDFSWFRCDRTSNPNTDRNPRGCVLL